MTLDTLVKGKRAAPIRLLLYAVEGLGKSTFASGAPSPVFLGPEDGTNELDVTRFPTPEAWLDVLDALRTLTVEQHEFKTIVIDTLDWLEPMCWKHICARDGQDSIETYGYAKGYVAALDEWRVFLSAIESLRRAKGMHVILLAHSWIKPFKNPEGDDFDRYEMKLHAKAGGLLKEWCDAVLFGNYETFANKDAKTKRVRGLDTGARLVYTQRRAAYDAKNRYDLPESLPLSWDDFFAATQARQVAAPAELKAAIEAGLLLLPADVQPKAREALVKCGDDAAKLAQLLNRINAKTDKGA